MIYVNDYCELTREQIEASLNFIRYVNREREDGRPIDITQVLSVKVVAIPHIHQEPLSRSSTFSLKLLS